MTGPAEQLLLKFGVDMDPLKKFVADMRAEIQKMQQDTSVLSEKVKAKAKEDAAYIKIVEQGAAEAVALSKAAVAAKAMETAELKAQAAEQKVIQEQQRVSIGEEKKKRAELDVQSAELKKQLDARRAETAEIQKQIAELRRKRMEEAAERSTARVAAAGGGGTGVVEAGFGSKLLTGATGAAFGGTTGTLMKAVLGGTLIATGAELAIHSVSRLIERFKALVEEAGTLTIVENQFKKVANAAGVDATESIKKMVEVTDGEVSKLNLMKSAIQALKAPLGLTFEDVVKLQGALTDIAEAHGRDREQAIQRLTMAFARGRPEMLAFAAGLTSTALRMQNLPPTMNRAQQTAERWRFAIQKLKEEQDKLGDWPTTYAQQLDHLHKAMRGVLLNFGQGVNEAGGSQMFLGMVEGWVKKIREAGGVAREVGRSIGNAMLFAVPFVESLKIVVSSLVDVLKTAGSAVIALFGVPAEASAQADWLKFLGHTVIALGTEADFVLTVFKAILKTVEVLAAPIGHLVQNLAALARGDLKEATKQADLLWKSMTFTGGEKLKQAWYDDWKKWAEGAATRLAEFDGKMYEAQVKAFLAARQTKEKVLPPPEDDTKPLGAQIKTAQLEMKERLALAKFELEQKKEQIEERKRLDNDAYQEGLVSLKEHIENQKRLITDGYLIQRQLAAVQLREQKVLLDERKKLGMIRPEDYRAEWRRTLLDFGTQEIKAREGLQRQLSAVDDQADKDRRAARAKEIQDELAERKRHINELQQLNEKSFNVGELTPEEYYAKRIELIQAIAEAEIDSANKVYDAGVKTAAAQQARINAIKAAVDTARIGLQGLTAGEDLAQKVLSSITRSFGPQQQALETQIGYQQSEGRGMQFNTPTADLLQSLQSNLSAQREELMRLLTLVKPYSDTWWQIYDRIENTYRAQVRYNKELREMQSLLEPIGRMFQQMASSIGQVFTSKFAQNLGQTLGQAASTLEQARRRSDVLTGEGKLQKDPALLKLENEAQSLFTKARGSADSLVPRFNTLSEAIGRAVQGLNRLGSTTEQPSTPDYSLEYSDEMATEGLPAATGKSTDAIVTFTEKVLNSVAALGDFVSTLTNARSGITGAVGGAMGGVGMANTFGGMLSKFTGIGAFGGPIGQAVGAAAGAVIGGITGAKNARVQRNIDRMNEQYKNLMYQFQLNTNNLQSTIDQLNMLISQARQMQASSKKGGSQYQQAIDSYTQQLMQLQSQQHQLLQSLKEQLAVLRQPRGMQEYLQSLQQILQQYEKFAGAAKTASDLADANEYLARSLSNYHDNLAKQLEDDNRQAIEDAIQLNDLYKQRRDFINDLNNQIAGALQRGVLTRQMTFAQQKGKEIYDIQLQAQERLRQMNDDIALAQYKVQQEGQVFQLAQTRIGLESQLLSLQKVQTDRDMLRITALAELVNAFASGAGLEFPAIQAIINSQQGVKLTGNAQWTDALDQLISGAYQDRASLGFGAFRASNL